MKKTFQLKVLSVDLCLEDDLKSIPTIIMKILLTNSTTEMLSTFLKLFNRKVHNRTDRKMAFNYFSISYKAWK